MRDQPNTTDDPRNIILSDGSVVRFPGATAEDVEANRELYRRFIEEVILGKKIG